MFAHRDIRGGGPGQNVVEVAFTDSSIDLQGPKPGFGEALARTTQECGVSFARLSQVHGDTVHVVELDPPVWPSDVVPTGDALVTTRRGVGLMVRVADCVPIVLADPGSGVIGAVHSGRPGLALGVAVRAVERMQELGARRIEAWIGPHVCGRCYEVPESMRAEVGDVVPEAWSTTSWGTPSLDIGAGAQAQLERVGVDVSVVGGCTLEEARYHSYRRSGSEAGRLAGLVWLR